MSVVHCFAEQVSPADASMETKDLTDRAANLLFFRELIEGTFNHILNTDSDSDHYYSSYC